MNAERRIQRVRKVINPIGSSKADWEIISAVANAMRGSAIGDRGSRPTVRDGAVSLNYASVKEIWNEIRQVWPGGRGITYERLENQGIQWPCMNEDNPGTEVLHRETFAQGKTTAFRRIPYQPTEETTDEDFPFLLNTGRTLYQFNAGTMTRRTPNLGLLPTDYLEMSPKDAEHLQLNNGDPVKVRSRFGEAILPVRVNSIVKPDEVFATFHDTNVFLNHVTGPHRDHYVKAPEYKVTAVSISKL
jgi:formate dehydrogenase major subunit